MSLTLVKWISRILGFLVLAAVGWSIGSTLDTQVPVPYVQFKYILAAVGGLIGFFVAVPLVLNPLLRLQHELRRVPIQSLLAATVGLAVGLLLSLPLSYAAQFLPFSLGSVAPVVISVALGYMGLMVGLVGQAPQLLVHIHFR